MASPSFSERLAAWREPGRWRAGAQLAAAVAIAWGLSKALGLPESFWAVMSVLIVMRPSAGSTLEASWDRMSGTFAGALVGLAAVWLIHHGLPAAAGALAVVLLLSFVGAAVPGLRSAPIAALIILSAGSLPGHSALQVALLRLLQIGIGVGVALAMALLSAEYRAGARFDAGCAALLRGMAKRLMGLAARAESAGTSHEAAEAPGTQGDGERARASLARLTVLAGGADLESRWPWRRRAANGTPQDAHRRRARTMGRVTQDVVVLDRTVRQMLAGSQPAADALPTDAAKVARAAASALAGMADALEGKAPKPDFALLARVAGRHASADAGARPLLAAPLALLLEDLRSLAGTLDGAASSPRPVSTAGQP